MKKSLLTLLGLKDPEPYIQGPHDFLNWWSDGTWGRYLAAIRFLEERGYKFDSPKRATVMHTPTGTVIRNVSVGYVLDLYHIMNDEED